MQSYDGKFYKYRKLVQEESAAREDNQIDCLLNLRAFYEHNYKKIWFRLFFPSSLANALQEEPLSPSKVYLAYFSSFRWIHFFFGLSQEIKSFDADKVTKTCLSLYEDNTTGEKITGRSLLRDDKFRDIQIYAASPNFGDLNVHPKIINDETFAYRVRILQFLQGQQDKFADYFNRILLLSSNFIIKDCTNILSEITCENLSKLDKDDLKLIHDILDYYSDPKYNKKPQGVFPVLKIIIDSCKEKTLLPILHFLMSQKGVTAQTVKAYTIPLLLLSEAQIEEYLYKINALGNYKAADGIVLAMKIQMDLLAIEESLKKPLYEISSAKIVIQSFVKPSITSSSGYEDTLSNLSIDPMAAVNPDMIPSAEQKINAFLRKNKFWNEVTQADQKWLVDQIKDKTQETQDLLHDIYEQLEDLLDFEAFKHLLDLSINDLTSINELISSKLKKLTHDITDKEEVLSYVIKNMPNESLERLINQIMELDFSRSTYDWVVMVFAHGSANLTNRDIFKEIFLLKPDEKEMNFFSSIITKDNSVLLRQENIILIHKFYLQYKDNPTYLNEFKSNPKEILTFMQNQDLSEYYNKYTFFIITFENIDALYQRVLLVQKKNLLDFCGAFINRCFVKNLSKETFDSLIEVIEKLSKKFKAEDIESIIDSLLILANDELQDLSLCIDVLQLDCNCEIYNLDNIKLAAKKVKSHALFSDLREFSMIFDGTKSLYRDHFSIIMTDPHKSEEKGLRLSLSEYKPQNKTKIEEHGFLEMGKGLFKKVSHIVHYPDRSHENNPKQ